MSPKKRNVLISKATIYHRGILLYRGIFFFMALALLVYRFFKPGIDYFNQFYFLVFFYICSVVFITEMIFRFLPNDVESMGCQKEFTCYYDGIEYDQNDIEEKKQIDRKAVITVGSIWICINVVIFILKHFAIIDDYVIWTICLFFGFCDNICILYFCPFQQFIMKNRCCVRCRIYNWNYLMMFSPAIFISNHVAHILFTLSLIIWLKWEYAYHKHPEYFAVFSNKALTCGACEEKLCTHKRALQSFIMKRSAFIQKELDKEKDKLKPIIKKIWQ